MTPRAALPLIVHWHMISATFHALSLPTLDPVDQARTSITFSASRNLKTAIQLFKPSLSRRLPHPAENPPSFINLLATSASTTINALPTFQTIWKLVRRGDPVRALVREENEPISTKISNGYVLTGCRCRSVRIVLLGRSPIWARPCPRSSSLARVRHTIDTSRLLDSVG